MREDRELEACTEVCNSTEQQNVEKFVQMVII